LKVLKAEGCGSAVIAAGGLELDPLVADRGAGCAALRTTIRMASAAESTAYSYQGFAGLDSYSLDVRSSTDVCSGLVAENAEVRGIRAMSCVNQATGEAQLADGDGFDGDYLVALP
jgi:hypothetical protein